MSWNYMVTGRRMLKLYLCLIKAHALINGLTQSNHIITGPSYLFSKFLLEKSLKNINYACMNTNQNKSN